MTGFFARSPMAFRGRGGRLVLVAGRSRSPCERVRAAEHAPRDPSRVLERRHGLAEIVERGA